MKDYVFIMGGGPGAVDKMTLVLNPETARFLMRELKKCLLPVYEKGKGYTDTFSLTSSGKMIVNEHEVLIVPMFQPEKQETPTNEPGI